MIKSKKGVELGFNTIIIAIISLIVLITIVAIFRGQISEIAQGFRGIRERETNESALKGVFGCDEGERTCRGDVIYECSNSVWVKYRECSNKCENGACV